MSRNFAHGRDLSSSEVRRRLPFGSSWPQPMRTWPNPPRNVADPRPEHPVSSFAWTDPCAHCPPSMPRSARDRLSMLRLARCLPWPVPAAMGLSELRKNSLSVVASNPATPARTFLVETDRRKPASSLNRRRPGTRAGVFGGCVLVEALGGTGQALFGRGEVLVTNHSQPREHILHLFLGIGAGDLEVSEVLKYAADPGADTVVTTVDAAVDLALDHPRVIQVVALRGLESIGLGQAAHGVVDRRDRLLLHGEHVPSSSRSSRRASSNCRAASSFDTILKRTSRLLPIFGPLIASKSRASAWKVMTVPTGSLSGVRFQS